MTRVPGWTKDIEFVRRIYTRIVIIYIAGRILQRSRVGQPMKKRSKKVKLSDLARAARVSTATVSRFVGARGGITAETRDRIVAAAERLGFDLEQGRRSR